MTVLKSGNRLFNEMKWRNWVSRIGKASPDVVLVYSGVLRVSYLRDRQSKFAPSSLDYVLLFFELSPTSSAFLFSLQRAYTLIRLSYTHNVRKKIQRITIRANATKN